MNKQDEIETIEFNNVKYIRKDRACEVKPQSQESIYQVGAKLLIRTVTHYQIGRVCFVSDDEIGLEQSSWVSDTGTFSKALQGCAFNEVEYFGGRSSVGRGAIVDVWVWGHDLPNKTK